MIPQDEIRISNKLIVLRKFFSKYLDIEVKQIRYSHERMEIFIIYFSRPYYFALRIVLKVKKLITRQKCCLSLFIITLPTLQKMTKVHFELTLNMLYLWFVDFKYKISSISGDVKKSLMTSCACFTLLKIHVLSLVL